MRVSIVAIFRKLLTESEFDLGEGQVLDELYGHAVINKAQLVNIKHERHVLAKIRIFIGTLGNLPDDAKWNALNAIKKENESLFAELNGAVENEEKMERIIQQCMKTKGFFDVKLGEIANEAKNKGIIQDKHHALAFFAPDRLAKPEEVREKKIRAFINMLEQLPDDRKKDVVTLVGQRQAEAGRTLDGLLFEGGNRETKIRMTSEETAATSSQMGRQQFEERSHEESKTRMVHSSMKRQDARGTTDPINNSEGTATEFKGKTGSSGPTPALDFTKSGQEAIVSSRPAEGSLSPAPSMKKGFRILCLDGGGVRGMIEATVLAKVQEGLPNQLHTYFDLICGTSTGGILAVALGVLKLSPMECQEFYRNLATQIFPAKTSFRKACSLLFKGASYNSNKLSSVLRRMCGDILKMDRGDSGPYIFTVATHKGVKQQLFLFRNYDNPNSNQLGWRGSRAWEAAVATASAPTYFHSFKKDRKEFLDGGLIANNPTEVAIIEAQAILERQLGQQDLVVSLGTGLMGPELKKSGKLPVVEMAFFVKDLVTLATETEDTHNWVRGHPERRHPGLRLFGAQESFANYFRLNPDSGKIPMDSSDGDTLKHLVDVAEHWATDGPGRAMIDALIKQLTE